MSDRLPGALRALADRFDDVRLSDDGLALEVAVVDTTVRVPVRGANEAMIALATIPLEGFRLSGKQRDVPYEDAQVRDGALDLSPRQYLFDSNDPALADLWLDTAARDALVAALYMTPRPDLELAGCTIRLAGDQCSGAAGGPSPGHVADVVRATAILATRPYRIARALQPVATTLGATISRERWDLGREFALLVERRGAAVRIDHVRSLPGEPRMPHLRTRVRTRRVGGGDDWALWRPDLDPSHRPRHPGFAPATPPPALAAYHAAAVQPERLADRLRPLAAVVAEAAPGALHSRDGEVALWWPGVIADHDHLDRAIEIVARLAIEVAAPQGPYR